MGEPLRREHGLDRREPVTLPPADPGPRFRSGQRRPIPLPAELLLRGLGAAVDEREEPFAVAAADGRAVPPGQQEELPVKPGVLDDGRVGQARSDQNAVILASVLGQQEKRQSLHCGSGASSTRRFFAQAASSWPGSAGRSFP